MIVKTNWSNFDPKSFEPFPDGSYDAEIVGVTQGKALTGTEVLNVDCQILGPTHVGRHAWANIYLTEKARWKLAALLSAVGLGLVDELVTDQLIGMRLRVRLRQKDTQDGVRSEVIGFGKSKSDTAVPF